LNSRSDRARLTFGALTQVARGDMGGEIVQRAAPPAAAQLLDKVVVPRMALRVIDRAIQAHGGAGVSDDFPLAAAWAHARTIRLADGPDEVHREAVAKLELAYRSPRGARACVPASASAWPPISSQSARTRSLTGTSPGVSAARARSDMRCRARVLS
jgi:hypothetical protein